MIKRAAAAIALLVLVHVAAGCGVEAIPDDDPPEPFEGKAVTSGAEGSVLVVGVRGGVGDRGCEQSLAVARLDAEGRTIGRAGVAAGSIDDSCRPQVDQVVTDRQGRLVVYGSSFDPGFLGGGEPGPSTLLRVEPSGRLDPDLGDGGVSADTDLFPPVVALPDGRLLDRYGTVLDGSETEEDALDLPEVGDIYPDDLAGLEDGVALAGEGIEVVRLDEGGEPLAGYGDEGEVSVFVGAEEPLQALIASPDGAVLLQTALTTSISEYRPVLRRVTPSGEQDIDFGRRGQLDLASGLGERFFLGAVEALPDGRVVSIGAERETGRVVIARFTAAGRPDEAFGPRGVRRLDVGVRPLSSGAEPEIDLALGRDGSITGLVGGDSTTPTRLVRLRPDGALDGRFGSDGILLLDSL